MARLRPREALRRPFAIQGTARVDRRTKDMIQRLQAGEIAVIDHRDLDRVAADGLIEAGRRRGGELRRSRSRAATRTAGRSASCGAGITLLDDVGADLMDRVQRRRRRPHRATASSGATASCSAAAPCSPSAEIEAAMEDGARQRSAASSSASPTNTLEYIQKEARLTFEPLTLPPIHTKFAGRHALVVVRGHDYRSDLAALRSYIREYRPVLIGVDGGADALLEHGLKPDIIIGDFDSVSEKGLRVRRRARAPRASRRSRARAVRTSLEWGVDYLEFVAEGTSEDVAMLLAYESKAQLIVAVGHPRHHGRVPRQGPPGHGVDLPHPAAARARCSSTPRA